MKPMSRLFLGLGVFLLASAVAYGFHSHEGEGDVLMFVAAGCAALFGGFLVREFRAASSEPAQDGDPAADDGEPHVGPTIWPVFLAVAMSGLVIGAIGRPWVLIVGGVLVFAACMGWILDVRRQWDHHFGHSADGAQHHGHRVG